MHILFATDGSESARFALAHILALPWPHPVHVTLLTVLDIPYPPLTSLTPAARRAYGEAIATLRREALDNAQAVVAEVRRELAPYVQSIAARIHEGSPGPRIVETAMACRGDLVVMGCQGLGAIRRVLFGSASTYVARSASCSVLLAKRPPSGERRFLLALDGSPHARAALQWLAHLDLSGEDWIQVVNVAESPRTFPGARAERQRAGATEIPDRFDAGASAGEHVLAEARLHLGARRPRFSVTARHGDPASELLTAAHEFGAEWLVLGATGRSQPDAALGAVARKVVSHAPCSTVVVRL
jgi:nucleotide-binding universal stress UspA family protein